MPLSFCGDIGYNDGMSKGLTMTSVHTKAYNEIQDDLMLNPMCQVVLFNDDHNTVEHVTKCLMQVFNHSFEMAHKLMIEAHESGRTIAQVEEQELAILHKQQLESFGLTAEVERIV